VITVELANRQKSLRIDRRRLRRAARMILEDASIADAEISVAVVDDPAIRRLNRDYLGHDYATDVLSFLLDRGEESLAGEVIVSADAAKAVAPGFGWPAPDELLLYVIHGMLHLVGCEDATPSQRAAMRRRERACLARFGLLEACKGTRTGRAPKGAGHSPERKRRRRSSDGLG